jgi:hypothetical protein
VPGTSLSALSTQYILIPVRATSGGAPYNPTADVVAMAFADGWAEPGSGAWNTGSWASTSTVNGYYLAQCLVGPQNGGNVLAIGTWNVWLRITDNPEVPVISAGTLTITP